MVRNTKEFIHCQSTQNQQSFVCLFQNSKRNFKTVKACDLAIFQNSNDPCISGAELKVDVSKKLNTKAELIEEA